MNFEPFVTSSPAKNGAYRRVLNLIHMLDILDTGIDDAVFVFKERGKMTTTDIAILVNRGSQYYSTMLLVPSRVIGATAEK